MASILLVEDMENPRKAISMLLKKKGYQVQEAANGKKALELLNKQFFDLVITDYKMEPIDGLKVLEETKRSHFSTDRHHCFWYDSRWRESHENACV